MFNFIAYITIYDSVVQACYVTTSLVTQSSLLIALLVHSALIIECFHY